MCPGWSHSIFIDKSCQPPPHNPLGTELTWKEVEVQRDGVICLRGWQSQVWTQTSVGCQIVSRWLIQFTVLLPHQCIRVFKETEPIGYTEREKEKDLLQGLPWCPRSYDSMLPVEGVSFPSLVRELDPLCTATKGAHGQNEDHRSWVLQLRSYNWINNLKKKNSDLCGLLLNVGDL